MHRILIVDDVEAVGLSISEYFRLHGYEVDYARDRIEAEDYLAAQKYSVLIEDIWISTSREGLAMVEYVKKRYPDTQIVVLTARDSAETRREAFLRGAAVFLSKPKPLAEIAQVVNGLAQVKELTESRSAKVETANPSDPA